jgi:hypothetical protein
MSQPSFEDSPPYSLLSDGGSGMGSVFKRHLLGLVFVHTYILILKPFNSFNLIL